MVPQDQNADGTGGGADEAGCDPTSGRASLPAGGSAGGSSGGLGGVLAGVVPGAGGVVAQVPVSGERHPPAEAW
jgi:hypothetical protein